MKKNNKAGNYMKLYDKNGKRIEAYDKSGNRLPGLTTWLEADMAYRPTMEENIRLYRVAIIEAVAIVALIAKEIVTLCRR